jgi:hypothetical protein
MAARLLGIIERIRRGRHAALARMHAGQTGLRCIRFREVVRVRGGNGGTLLPVVCQIRLDFAIPNG